MKRSSRTRTASPTLAQQNERSGIDQPTDSIFVGRARELAELHSYLEAAFAGNGRLILLIGEPGIGKTRLASEFAATALRRGALVFWGRCWEGPGSPAFWPWVQIVRTSLQYYSLEVLAADMGAGAVDIAQVIREVRDRLPNLPSPPVLEPELARFRFFDSLTMWVKKAASRQPLLFILDDLHWVDPSSLLLLHFLARELCDTPLLIVGSYREAEVDRNHPLSDTLSALARESQRLVLTGLTENEVARFLANIAGAPPPTRLLTAVYEKTEGNPFFLNELVYLLKSQGQLSDSAAADTGRISIPQGVRDTIRRRVEGLSPACLQFLAVAAVIGREFSLKLFAGVSRENSRAERDRLLALLQEALAARIISEVSSETGRYRFVHMLVRETLYEDLPIPERIRLHHQIGEAIEKLYEADLCPYFAELADHFCKAAAGGDTAKAIDYTEKAGERALALLAYEEAAGHYERALQILPFTERNELRRGELLLTLGEARSYAGETQRAREAFLQAAAIARKLGVRERTLQLAHILARAAIGFGKVWMVTGTGVVDEPLVTLLEEARAALGETDSILQARVLARLAAELRWSAPREQRAVLSQQAVSMARRRGDPRLRLERVALDNVGFR